MCMNSDTTPTQPARLSHRIVAIVAIGACGAFAINFAQRPNAQSLIEKADGLLESSQYRSALIAAQKALSIDPGNVDATVAAGDACFGVGDFDQALAYFEAVRLNNHPKSLHATERCGLIHMKGGNAATAEDCFRSVLESDPEHLPALVQLASLLGIQSRREEAVPFILTLFRLGHFDEDLLSLVQSPNSALSNKSELDRYLRLSPQHAGALVGAAWHERLANRDDDAIQLLRRAISAKPEFAEPRVALAQLYWHLDRMSDLAQLLNETETHDIVSDARLWGIRGALAERIGQHDAATRCYWNAYRLEPHHPRALYHLYSAARAAGDLTNAQLVERQIQAVDHLQDVQFAVASQPIPDWNDVKKLVAQLEVVGRHWEAWGWSAYAGKHLSKNSWAASKKHEYSKQLKSLSVLQLCTPIDGLTLDFSDLPRPSWGSVETTDPSGEEAVHRVVFEDVAERVGLTFSHHSLKRTAADGLLMLQLNGSGVAVLDYDHDGWPDIYFTQPCEWPVEPNPPGNIDRLFRNHQGVEFSDVTTSCHIVEEGFSTGVTVCDYNSDGFDDLYVANIGPNRLLLNNGDGTFNDVTDAAGVGDPGWSTSCVVADFSGDGLPDVYSVNYLQGEQIFERVCQHKDGRPRMCLPFQFEAQQDRFYLNLGDGRFRDLTETCGIKLGNGKGLGVVAADFNGDGRLGLFVANDTVANTFFANTSVDGDAKLFDECALPTGLAYNGEGKPEACMGIAAGDMDGDGDLDLYVTNFYSETNTLFRRDGEGFSDATREAGIAESSRGMLGFGTQFLDADLDGRLDLLVANGHIDDYRPYGRPYKMRAQFYWNAGSGRFVESKGGEHFNRELRGRAMARLDWNRDGREDVVITDMDEPAALLTNTTKSHGNNLTIRLRGRSSRCAIGARVVVRVGGRSISRHLTAGDGYQASNQRQLVFGLAAAQVVDVVEVSWPSGISQKFHRVAGNHEYIVVEGQEILWRTFESAVVSP